MQCPRSFFFACLAFLAVYTSNIKNYVRQSLLLEYISKLRTSQIMFDLGLGIKCSRYVGQLWKSMAATLRRKLCQHVFWEFHCNYATSKIFCLRLFLNM